MSETHKHNFEDMMKTSKIIVRFYCSTCESWIEEEVDYNYDAVSNKIKEMLTNSFDKSEIT